MKKLFSMILALAMILSLAACGGQNDTTGTSDTQSTADTQPTESTTESQPTDPAVNEGQLQMGIYGGSATYAEEGFSMTWTFTITFNEDNSFVLINDAGEEKGAGTWALTDTCYTLTYSDDCTATFVVLSNGALKITADLPYGLNAISPDVVGGIELTYVGEASTQPQGAALAAGTYYASYTKESAMAGTVTYIYTATVGEDGTFSYSVTFDMAGTTHDGSAASGTYTLEAGVFTFTDTEGNVTVGAVSEDNTLVISLMASAMASTPYEVTFTNEPIAAQGATLAAGTYTASYTKESAMAGTVTYIYTATVGEDGTFSYSVTFDMAGTTHDGSAASGTYTLEAGVFTFTDTEGNVTVGAVTEENTLVISLFASSMASTPYEVTFTVAQ